MKNYRNLLALGLLITISFCKVSAQFQSRGKAHNYEDAMRFFVDGNFFDAKNSFITLHDSFPKVDGYKWRSGVCILEVENNPEKAILHLEEYYAHHENLHHILYYLGRAYMLNYEFDKAIEYFKQCYDKHDKVKDVVHFKETIPLLIEQCNNAKKLYAKDQVFTINKLKGLNSIGREFSPVISKDGKQLYYTYNGDKCLGGRMDNQFYEDSIGSYKNDIYVANLNNNNVESNTIVGSPISTKYSNSVAGLSQDNKTLYIIKESETVKDKLYECKFENDTWGALVYSDINYEEGGVFGVTQYKNDTKMIFSSNRPGGKGGKDLYSAEKDSEGFWGNITNLGPSINTEYDEDAPFVYKDQILIFASTGHQSMGEHDIIYSKILDEGYALPQNMGYPINTPGDNIFMTLSDEGLAYFSSKIPDSEGQSDIYSVDLSNFFGELTPNIGKENNETLNSNIEELVAETKNGKVKEETPPTLPKADKPKPLGPLTTYDQVLKRFGAIKHPGLVYKIQVGAYYSPDKYKGHHENIVGKVDSYVSKNGITHFTIGNYSSLNEADQAVNKVKNSGTSDAFIMIFFNDIHVHKAELIEQGIFK